MNEKIKEIAEKLIDDCIIFKVWRNGKDLCIEEEEFYLPNEVRSRFFSSDLGADEGQILYYNDRIEICLNFVEYYNDDEPFCDENGFPATKAIRLATAKGFDEAQRIKKELKAKGVPSVYPDWKSRIGSEIDKNKGGVL